MKKYQMPAIKVMATAMTAYCFAASTDFSIGSDEFGEVPIIPGGGNPSDAI